MANIDQLLQRNKDFAATCAHQEASVPVLSKSTHRDRIAENGRIFDFELTSEELKQLDALDRTGGAGNALENKWW